MTLRDRIEDLVLAVSFRLPPLEVELVVPQLEKGPHLVNMNPGKRSYSREKEEWVRNGCPHIHSAVHSAMRKAFLKSLGRLFVFMRKSSMLIPYLSAADARIGTGACSCASSGATAANHS